MTANQLVAANLRRIREERGLTQEQAAELLEPLLGRRWSKASFSHAETSVSSGKVREFSANEIIAFSAAFGVPIGYFFQPLDEGESEPVTAGGQQEINLLEVGMSNTEVEFLHRMAADIDKATRAVRAQTRELLKAADAREKARATTPQVSSSSQAPKSTSGRRQSGSKTKGGRHGKTS